MKAQWIYDSMIYSDGGKGMFGCASGCSWSGSTHIQVAEAAVTVIFFFFPPLFWYVSHRSELSGPAANLLRLHQFGYLPGTV